MRPLFKYLTFLLLYMPDIAGATTQVPANSSEFDAPYFNGQVESTAVKRGFLERVAEKTLLKRLKKAEKTMGRSGDSDGKWLAISGFALGVLGIFSFAFISYTAFYLPLALSLGGLLLSILGLVKASGWQDTRWIRIFAITGIVINAIALVGAVGLIGSF